MPRTKTAKKKQSKVKRTLAWFKPTTPAKGLLVFALVFGLIGGGYALKKSLAAPIAQTGQAGFLHIKQYGTGVGSKGHCHMETSWGVYLGVAYTKARIKSDINGRNCQMVAYVKGTNGQTAQKRSIVWGSTSWSGWYQASVGPITGWHSGNVQLINYDTGNWTDFIIVPS